MSTMPIDHIPHIHGSGTPPGMSTPPPWAACAHALTACSNAFIPHYYSLITTHSTVRKPHSLSLLWTLSAGFLCKKPELHPNKSHNPSLYVISANCVILMRTWIFLLIFLVSFPVVYLQATILFHSIFIVQLYLPWILDAVYSNHSRIEHDGIWGRMSGMKFS